MATSLNWKQLLLLITILASNITESSIPDKLKYKTNFNNCPSQSAGKFAMYVLKVFENTESLYDVKTEINQNFLQSKYFIKNYEIGINPDTRTMDISLECPRPLLRVVLMDSEAEGEFQSVLVDEGELFDPTYETLLLGEKKISSYLPTFAVNKSKLTQSTRKSISKLIHLVGDENFSKISEVILNDDHALTMILSINKKPVSVFIGTDNYNEKAKKLRRLLKYVNKNKKQPKVINLVNLKKVVVKFAHKK